MLVIKRTLEVCLTFGRWFLGGKIQGTATTEALSAHQAERLRCILTDLGPAFVKIGQVSLSHPSPCSNSMSRRFNNGRRVAST